VNRCIVLRNNSCIIVFQSPRTSASRQAFVLGVFRSSAFALAAPLLVSGCTRSFMFRVVDGQSGAPLAGVETQRESSFDDLVFGSRHSSGQLPPSGPGGLISANGLSSQMEQRFVFHKDGYAKAIIIWDAHEPGRLSYLSPSYPSDPTPFTWIKTEAIVTVRMYPMGVGGFDPFRSHPGPN
jgi:hypothetical protein